MSHLLLANNSMSGSLPAAWAARTSWPALTALFLQSNNLSGAVTSKTPLLGLPSEATQRSYLAMGRLLPHYSSMVVTNWISSDAGAVPGTWATNTSFPALTELVLQPGNQLLCGNLSTAAGYSVYYLSSTVGNCSCMPGSPSLAWEGTRELTSHPYMPAPIHVPDEKPAHLHACCRVRRIRSVAHWAPAPRPAAR